MPALHAKNLLPMVPASVTGVPLVLPAPVASLIIEVGRVKEKVPVEMKKKGQQGKS